MTEAMAPGVGGVLSADIAVPDHEREVQFYSSVLCTGETSPWRDDLMNSLGMPIIGLGARIPEYEHLPLQWMPHIQVADVAASAERALALKGTELMHGKDDDGASQWAVLLDPYGAAFGIIPVVPAEALAPADGVGSPGDVARAGRISGLSLTVPDAAAAQDFYGQVVGWSMQEADMLDDGVRYIDYSMLDAGGRPAAGICHGRGENLGLPATWVIHLPVGDLEESLRRVEAGGGKVIKVTRGPDGKPVRAVIQDPVGACLALGAEE